MIEISSSLPPNINYRHVESKMGQHYSTPDSVFSAGNPPSDACIGGSARVAGDSLTDCSGSLAWKSNQGCRLNSAR